MDKYEKKDYSIVWQSTMKAAIDLVPQSEKDVDKRYEIYKDYHRKIFSSYVEWIKQLDK